MSLISLFDDLVIEMKVMKKRRRRVPAVYKSHCSLHSSLTMSNHSMCQLKNSSYYVMTLSLTHSTSTYNLELTEFIRSMEKMKNYTFFVINEVLNLRLNICLSDCLLLLLFSEEDKFDVIPEYDLFKHFSSKQTLRLLSTCCSHSFTLE